MCATGRALAELIGVLAAGFVGFFVMLAYMAGSMILFACGVACFSLLLVAVFSMVMWLLTDDTHACHLMLGYFVYAGATYAGLTAMSYYRGRVTDLVRGRLGRAATERIDRRRLAEEADFDPTTTKWSAQ